MPCDARTSAVGRQGCKGRVIHKPDQKSSMLILRIHILGAGPFALYSSVIFVEPVFKISSIQL